MKIIQGIPASRGIAAGPAFHYRKMNIEVPDRFNCDPALEWERLQRAMTIAEAQLQEVYEITLRQAGKSQAEIFQAHLMMLTDPDLQEAVQANLQDRGCNAELALFNATQEYARIMEGLEDEYLRARAADIRDVADRLLRILLDLPDAPAKHLIQPSIILAEDLAPSDTAALDKALVLGFCTTQGGPTAHTAILARSLGLPAVVGTHFDFSAIPEGAPLLMDGFNGTLVVEPDAETTQRYESKGKSLGALLAAAQEKASQPVVTLDGLHVEVVANIGGVSDARKAVGLGAEGVGLLRTEFLYLDSDHLPDEEEQYLAYREIVEIFGEQPVVLRTLDIGGDKELPFLKPIPEMNPFLGLRALRLCLVRPELFRPQLRAALRAGVGRNLKLMFPMVATPGEVRAGRAMLEQCRQELRSEGKQTADAMEIGIMVEIPAAAICADQLAKEVDFFSIGTNDLSQYTMAADRTNANVAGLASAFQPAVLRLIQMVIEAGHRHGKWVGMCGELAGEPLALPILLGMGLDEFSMNAPAIPFAKQILRSLRQDELRGLAQEALHCESPEAVQDLVRRRIPQADL